MAVPVQIAIDCVDPHAQARFWADAMGYEVQHDDGGFIQGLLDQGQISDDEVVTVEGRLAFKAAAACNDPDGVGPRLLFQVVPEGKEVKNRVHLDLRIGDDDRAATVARLEANGATKLWDGQQGPFTWVTMADPEGNEFCVS